MGKGIEIKVVNHPSVQASGRVILLERNACII